MSDTNCLRCGYEFKADLPEWMAAVLCDTCQDALTTYIAGSSGPRQAARRIKASRRLYAPADVPAAGEVLPCEVDFTPQPAPVYDEVSDAGPNAAKGYFMRLYERQATARCVAAAPIILESLDRNDPNWRDRFNDAARLREVAAHEDEAASICASLAQSNKFWRDHYDSRALASRGQTETIWESADAETLGAPGFNG